MLDPGSKHAYVLARIHEADLLGQPVWMAYVVGIHPGYVLALRHLTPPVESGHQTTVWLIEDGDSVVGHPVAVQDLPRAVSRTIIDDDELKVRERLRQDAVNSASYVPVAVVDRHHHADWQSSGRSPMHYGLAV